MESFSIKGESIDVSKIMQKIQDRIRKKQRNGIYTDEELEEVTRLRLETLADEVDIDSSLIEHLRSSHATWNIAPNYRVKSHRKAIGYPISLLKKIVRPFIRLYTDHIVNRQAQLNLYSIHILHNLVQELTKLQIENRKLKNRLERVEKTQKMNTRRYTNTEKKSGTPRAGRNRNLGNKKK